MGAAGVLGFAAGATWVAVLAATSFRTLSTLAAGHLCLLAVLRDMNLHPQSLHCHSHMGCLAAFAASRSHSHLAAQLHFHASHFFSFWVFVTNQGIGLQQTDTKPPCHKGNKHRTHSFGFPTGLGPDGLQEIHVVTLYFKPQSVGMSSTKHGKVVPQLDDQVIILLRKSGTTYKRINQHTQESHASHCDITHAKWHHFCMN